MGDNYHSNYGPNYGIATIESQEAPKNIYGMGGEHQHGQPEVTSAEEAARKAPPPKYEEIFGTIATKVKPSTGIKVTGPKAETKEQKDAKRNECLKGLFFLALFIWSIVGLSLGGQNADDCPYDINIPISVILLASGYIVFYILGACVESAENKKKARSVKQAKQPTPNKKEGCVPVIFLLLILYMFATNLYGKMLCI